jgi:hypothetical protein
MGRVESSVRPSFYDMASLSRFPSAHRKVRVLHPWLQGGALALCVFAGSDQQGLAQDTEPPPEPVMTLEEQGVMESRFSRKALWFLAGSFVAHAFARQVKV